MNKSKRYLFIAMILVSFLFVFGNLTIPAGASNLEIVSSSATNTPTPQLNSLKDVNDSTVPDEIKGVIQSYFELRYRALNTLQPDSFENLVSGTSQAKAFLDAELSKLAVEIKHARLNHLKYASYKFSLDFIDFLANSSDNTVTVLVSESNEVIYELSEELNPEEPPITYMYGLVHTIILQKEGNRWKIISDDYTDSLWRMLRQTGISTNELLSTMQASPRLASHTDGLEAKFSCNLPYDASTLAYERYDDSGDADELDGAVNYALAHIAPEDYNPNYPNYDDGEHGDCTNYVSQAIYEGGWASMAYCDPEIHSYCNPEEGSTSGWYYTDPTHRASAWNDVGQFYTFIVNESPSLFNEGPEGCETTVDNLMLGDVIQYEQEGDNIWDHAVIVVDIIGGTPYVASHSENIGPVPYTHFDWFGDSVRGIHIERIDISTPRGFDSNGISVTYYNDADDGHWVLDGPITWDTFTPPVAHSRLESFIAFNTGTNSPAPGVNGTFWSAVWEGNLQVPQNGYYTFRFKNLDDGARLFVDNMSAPLLESWLVQGYHNYPSLPISLSQGLHDFRVEFAQGPGNDCGLIVEWDLEYVFREKIGPYSGEISTPTPTPTPTTTPTPTPTPTPTLTPTPTSTPTLSPTITESPEPTPTPVWPPAEEVLMKDEPAEKSEAFSALLSQVRDKVLLSSAKGYEYIDSIYQHALEIMQLLMKDEALRQEVKVLAIEVQPLLESMLDNQAISEKLYLDKAWVEQTIVILTKIEGRASPELREEVQWWKDRLPDFVGKTGMEIWEILPEKSH